VNRIPPLVLVTLATSLLALGSCSKSSTAPGSQAPTKPTVTVTVHDSLGTPQANALVTLVRGDIFADSGASTHGFTDAVGGLEIQLEPGEWTAKSVVFGRIAGGSFTVPSPQAVPLVLHTPSRVTGVAMRSGQSDHRDLFVGATALLAITFTDSSGAYDLRWLPPGEWEVRFIEFRGGFTEQVRRVSVPAPGSAVPLPPVVLEPVPVQ